MSETNLPKLSSPSIPPLLPLPSFLLLPSSTKHTATIENGILNHPHLLLHSLSPGISSLLDVCLFHDTQSYVINSIHTLRYVHCTLTLELNCF